MLIEIARDLVVERGRRSERFTLLTGRTSSQQLCVQIIVCVCSLGILSNYRFEMRGEGGISYTGMGMAAARKRETALELAL